VAAAWQGVFPALVTPMTAEEEIDCKTLSKFIDHLIEEGGVHGVIPLGSTGEYYALTTEERHLVVETTLEAVGGRVPVVVGCNAAATREVIEHCRYAEQSGASGVLLPAPYYSLPSHDELFEHYRAVDRAIGVPIMLYNYPGRTGVDMTPELIRRLAQLDQVQYVKESSGDVTRVSQIMRLCGDQITVFCGCDNEALEHFALGAQGWVGGAVNFLPEAHVRLFELMVGQQDLAAARSLYYTLLPVLCTLEAGGKYTQYVKACCGLQGHPVGPPRKPLLPPSPSELEELRGALEQFNAAWTASHRVVTS